MLRTSLPLSLALMALPAELVSQEIIRVSDQPACDDCRIELRRIATLTDTDGAAAVGEMGMVTRDSRGRLFLSEMTIDPWSYRLYDDAGSFLTHFGRKGSGPGEFQRLMPAVFGRADTLYAIDMAAIRLTRLSPELEYVDSYPFPGVPETLFVNDDGTMVAAAAFRTRDLAGWPLHLLDRTGRVVRSFGATTARLDPAAPYDGRRVIARSGAGHVWSASINRYVIERWNLQGDRTLTIERSADWFRPWRSYSGPSTVVRPPPTVVAVWEDANEYLWVAIAVPDKNWQRTNFRAQEGESIPMPRADNHSLFDTVIEVIDVRAGTLLTRQTFPLFLQTMGDGQPVVAYREDTAGNPLYDVWEPVLHGRMP